MPKLTPKRIVLTLLTVLIYLAGVVYLSLEQPPVSALPGALRSDEPGDTWQHPDQSAYFTNLSRQEVLDFYQDSFSLSLFNLNIKFPSFRLNYRPEDTATYVRKHIDSYYLEEIVHPLRESLFVNGWTPSQSPLLEGMPQGQRDTYTIAVNGEVFQSKITLKPYYSSLPFRLLVWTLLFPAVYLVYLSLKSALRELLSVVKDLSVRFSFPL